MSESLRDQLLKAGFKPSPKVKPAPKPHVHKPELRKPHASAEPDLAQAFAMRAKADRDIGDAASAFQIERGFRALNLHLRPTQDRRALDAVPKGFSAR